MSQLMSPLQLRATLLALCALSLCASGPGLAQRAAAPAPPPPTQPAPPALPSTDSVSWVPQGMATLAQQASTHTDFTFDRSMLMLAGKLGNVDATTRQVIARLDGIAVHLYRFPSRDAYSPATIQSIRAQYEALGWKHFTTTKKETALDGQTASHTDVWLNMHGINIAGAAILLAGPSEVNLIAIQGDLSTLDILHLRGHFGIPQFPAEALPH